MLMVVDYHHFSEVRVPERLRAVAPSAVQSITSNSYKRTLSRRNHQSLNIAKIRKQAIDFMLDLA